MSPYEPFFGLPDRLVWSLLAVFCLLLTACGQKQVNVGEEFPVPVMQKTPVHAGLVVDEAFSSYQHSEKLPGAGDWSIALGPANEAMFTRLLDGMFADLTVLSDTSSGGDARLLVKPELQEFQFSTPELSFTEFFEAWFKYRISFYGADGQVISEWPLAAYGRSEARLLAGKQALADATELALRDAAAGFATRFARDEAIQAYLRTPAR